MEQERQPRVRVPLSLRVGGSAGDGQYHHLYDLGMHEFHDGVYIWFGTTGGVNAESVRAVYVDRVLFVKE